MDTIIQLVEKNLNSLEEAVETFLLNISKPIYIYEKSKVRFRFPQIVEDSGLFQILKLVSVVSSLRGCLLLLKNGFIQEVGILFRSINENLTAIDFVQEAHENGAPLNKQREIIAEFFKQDLLTPDEMKEKDPEYSRIPRSKIINSLTRIMEPFYKNVDEMKRGLKWIDFAWSGYVHADYPNVMELFESVDGVKRFRLNGMLETPKMASFTWYLISFISKAFYAATTIARNLEYTELAGLLSEERKIILQIDLYKNYNPDNLYR